MCSLEFSDLEPTFQRYRDRGLKVVGVNPGGLYGAESRLVLEQFRAQTGATFPLGWEVSRSYQELSAGGGPSLSPFPLDVIVDAQGRLAYVSNSYDPLAMTAVLERLLGPE